MQRQFSFGRLFVLILVVVVLVGGGIFASKLISGNGNPSSPANPAQPNQPTEAQPANPSNPALPVVPGQPSAPLADGDYAVLCKPGTTLPQLDIAVDGYPGYYPLFLRIAAMPASEFYCINLITKWDGPKYDQHGFEESDIEMMLRDGRVDVYFGTNGGLSLFNSESAIVIWSPSQSTNADQIWALNSVAPPGVTEPSFNDLLGRKVITSKGGADHFMTLKMMQTVGLTPDDVSIIFPEEGTGNPVDNFCNGKAPFVAYWAPIIDGANCQDAKVLATTKWWRIVTDYIVISRDADTNMESAVAHFLADYNVATEGFTKENIPATAKILVDFHPYGQNLADWMFLDKSDPAGSLSSLLDGVAIATLNDNVTMFEKDPTGSSKVKDQFIRAHNTWIYGRVYDNGNPGALFNADIFISDKYMKLLADGGAKQVKGEFNNQYDTDISQNPPAVDDTILVQLPELLTLPYKNIKFVPNRSNLLVDGEEEHLLELVQPIAYFMAESDDAVLVIQGGSGNYTTDPDELRATIKFAFSRSQYIKKLLSDKLGIPIQRIILDTNVLLPDHYPSTKIDPKTGLSEMDNYTVVIISVRNSGNLK